MREQIVARRRALVLDQASDDFERQTPDFQHSDFLGFTGPVDRCDELGALSRRLELDRRGRIGDAVTRVMRELRQQLQYEKGVTSSTSAVSVKRILVPGWSVKRWRPKSSFPTRNMA